MNATQKANEEISALIADLEATRAERDKAVKACKEVIENNYKDLRVLADNRKLVLIIRKLNNISCGLDQCDECPYHKNGAGASLCPFIAALKFVEKK